MLPFPKIEDFFFNLNEFVVRGDLCTHFSHFSIVCMRSWTLKYVPMLEFSS